MINEKRKLEYYNYILKILAMCKLAKFFNDMDKIEEIEKTAMDMLNNFENCNFNKINFFSKEEVVTPAVGFILLIKNENNEFLFKKNKDELEVLYNPFEILKSMDENINEYLKNNNLEISEDYKVKGVINEIPLKEEEAKINNYFSTPMYLFILTSQIKSYNMDSDFIFIKKSDIKDTKLFSKNEIIKFIDISINDKFFKE